MISICRIAQDAGAEHPQFLFLPLGGAGEIGMNLNLYGYGPKNSEKWVMVDLGITFSKKEVAGVDVLMPDPFFIEERRAPTCYS